MPGKVEGVSLGRKAEQVVDLTSYSANVRCGELVFPYGIRLAVTIGTIDRSIAAGFERHLRVFTAGRTLHRKQLPGSRAVASIPVSTAVEAAGTLSLSSPRLSA